MTLFVIFGLVKSPDNTTAPRSPSLRGGHHSRVPGIPSEPLDTLLPETKEGAAHCRPYYITQVILLLLLTYYHNNNYYYYYHFINQPLILNMDTGTFPPWSAVTKQVRRLQIYVYY